MLQTIEIHVESIPGETELKEAEEKEEKCVEKKEKDTKETLVNMSHGQPIISREKGTLSVTEDKEDKEERQESMRRYVEVWAAEVMGTGLLLCLGCMGCIQGFTHDPVSNLQSSTAFGLVVASIIQLFGHVSAAHLNPCVTLCFYILEDISFTMMLNYLAAETTGAMLGYGLLKALTPDSVLAEQPALCCTLVDSRLSSFQALGIEFLSTGVLVMLVCSCSHPANSGKQDSVPLKFGVFVAVIGIVAGPYTGASINPTRTLAPAFWNGVWKDQWIYWAGPLSASIVFPMLYQTMFSYTRPNKKRTILKRLGITKAS